MAPRAAAPKAAATKAAASKATKPRNETKFKKKPAAAKQKPIDFKSQATVDYPYHTWNNKGRKCMALLERKKPSEMTAYETFLLRKHFPDQRKEFSQQEQRKERADKISIAAAKEERTHNVAQERTEKRKERRRKERSRIGMASPQTEAVEPEDEVYERRGATVRVIYLSQFQNCRRVKLLCNSDTRMILG